MYTQTHHIHTLPLPLSFILTLPLPLTLTPTLAHTLTLFHIQAGDMEGLPTVALVPFEPLVLWTDTEDSSDTPHKIEVVTICHHSIAAPLLSS